MNAYDSSPYDADIPTLMETCRNCGERNEDHLYEYEGETSDYPLFCEDGEMFESDER